MLALATMALTLCLSFTMKGSKYRAGPQSGGRESRGRKNRLADSEDAHRHTTSLSLAKQIKIFPLFIPLGGNLNVMAAHLNIKNI